MDILVLFLILRKTLLAYPCWVWSYLWVGHIWPLLWWGMFSPFPFCWDFYHKWVLDFVRCFLQWLIWLYMFIHFVYVWFADIEPTLIPGINPTWSWWCVIFLMYCRIQFANNFLKIFTPVYRGYWHIIFIFCNVCLILESGYLSFIKRALEPSLLLNFWE